MNKVKLDNLALSIKPISHFLTYQTTLLGFIIVTKWSADSPLKGKRKTSFMLEPLIYWKTEVNVDFLRFSWVMRNNYKISSMPW